MMRIRRTTSAIEMAIIFFIQPALICCRKGSPSLPPPRSAPRISAYSPVETTHHAHRQTAHSFHHPHDYPCAHKRSPASAPPASKAPSPGTDMNSEDPYAHWPPIRPLLRRAPSPDCCSDKPAPPDSDLRR